MSRPLKQLLKRSLPPSLVRRLSEWKNRNSTPAADRRLSERAKREFFWHAFKALDYNGIDGDYVEFGSFGARTFCFAYDQIRARRMARQMWSFDSFQGLPNLSSPFDQHPEWRSGMMAMSVAEFHRACQQHGIPRTQYTAVPGFYSDTLAALADDAPPANIALAYVDCDLYSSAKTVLEFLQPRLKHGMLLAFDDYFCWTTRHVAGERRAFIEVLATDPRWNLLRYRDISWGGVAFVVERSDSVSEKSG